MFFAQGAERGEGVSGKGEVGVDFIGDDGDAVCQTDVGHGGEFVTAPDTPDGVVRVAQDEQPDVVVDDFALEVGQIDGVASVFEYQRVVDEASPVVGDGAGEGVIDGRLDEDGIAFARGGADGGAQCEYDARCHDEPVFVDLPVVAAGEPVADGFEVAVAGFGVAVDGVFRHGVQGFCDGGRTTEIHVGDPHRQDVLRFAAGQGGVEFE